MGWRHGAGERGRRVGRHAVEGNGDGPEPAGQLGGFYGQCRLLNVRLKIRISIWIQQGGFYGWRHLLNIQVKIRIPFRIHVPCIRDSRIHIKVQIQIWIPVWIRAGRGGEAWPRGVVEAGWRWRGRARGGGPREGCWAQGRAGQWQRVWQALCLCVNVQMGDAQGLGRAHLSVPAGGGRGGWRRGVGSWDVLISAYLQVLVLVGGGGGGLQLGVGGGGAGMVG